MKLWLLHKPFPCDFNTRMLNCTSAPYHGYWQLILLLETTERWQITDFFCSLQYGSAFKPSQTGWSFLLLTITWRMESLSIWSLAGVVVFYLPSRTYSPKYTEGVAHTQLWRNRFKRCLLMPSLRSIVVRCERIFFLDEVRELSRQTTKN